MLQLFHGSACAVPQPDIDRCRPNNDYGRGFYCTESFDLACEWACQKGVDGFVSGYELSLRGLNVIDLGSPNFTVLHWLQVLFSHRLLRLSTPVMQQGARWLQANFAVDLSDADLVHGYRADDSYFGFARAFLRNEITLGQLSRALVLGDLGTQYMVKSPQAFKRLQYTGSQPADASIWWPRQMEREDDARCAFEEILVAAGASGASAMSADMRDLVNGLLDDSYLSDLMELSKEELNAGLR